MNVYVNKADKQPEKNHYGQQKLIKLQETKKKE